jgi:hypothetical protein
MKLWQIMGAAGFFLAAMGSGPVQAQYFGGSPDYREAAQQERIHRGMASGALTPQEARKLGKEQRHIDAAQQRMWSDGRLTPRERARLDKMQDKADRHIYREIHDRQVASSGYQGHHRPAPRHWQNNHRQHHPGIGAPRQHHRGPQYGAQGHGRFPQAVSRPQGPERGRFLSKPSRDRRVAWGR